jgi:hypothetical protein
MAVDAAKEDSLGAANWLERAAAAVARRDDEASSLIFDSCAVSVAEDVTGGSSPV